MVLTPIIGCGGPYGRLSVSETVKMQIESYEVLPDHRYYYSGSFARPRAVIGVQEDYTLQSDLWVSVNLTPGLLRAWVDYFGAQTKYFQASNGSDILSENGNKIGVWYAFIDWKDWARIKMIDEKTVSISTPIVRQEELFFWRWGFTAIPDD
jgi:hypothetical protein